MATNGLIPKLFMVSFAGKSIQLNGGMFQCLMTGTEFNKIPILVNIQKTIEHTPFIVDFPSYKWVIFHSYVNVYQLVFLYNNLLKKKKDRSW